MASISDNGCGEDSDTHFEDIVNDIFAQRSVDFFSSFTVWPWFFGIYLFQVKSVNANGDLTFMPDPTLCRELSAM